MKSIPLLLLFPLFAASLGAGESESKSDFTSPGLPPGWVVAKGEWTVRDGALFGAEIPDDRHAAVLSIPDPHLESTIRLRFRLDGAKGFHLSYNHAKGHLFRVTVNAGEVTLVMDKDKKDPDSKSVTLARASLELGAGKWTELSCSVKEGKATVKVGGATLEGAHPDLAKEKTGYRLVVQGQSVAFDDVAYSSSQ